jgi:exonuclease I
VSQKSFVLKFIRKNTTVCSTDFYFPRPYSWLVTPMGRSAGNGNEILAFDLANDPAEIGDLTDTELALRLVSSPKPIRRVRVNAFPVAGGIG